MLSIASQFSLRCKVRHRRSRNATPCWIDRASTERSSGSSARPSATKRSFNRLQAAHRIGLLGKRLDASQIAKMSSVTYFSLSPSLLRGNVLYAVCAWLYKTRVSLSSRARADPRKKFFRFEPMKRKTNESEVDNFLSTKV